jgi:MYXO-CTERM domain-containing protein
MTPNLPDGVQDWFWARHSNPKSGWSRVPTGAVIVYAVYQRRWRLLVAALLWTAINPVLFAPPDDQDAWMTRAVLAERWWLTERDNGTLGLSSPNVCNTGGALAAVLALYAAWRRRPVSAAVATLAMSGLKLWWLCEIVQRYDARGGVTGVRGDVGGVRLRAR